MMSNEQQQWAEHGQRHGRLYVQQQQHVHSDTHSTRLAIGTIASTIGKLESLVEKR